MEDISLGSLPWDPLLACFISCVQWIPQIHLWYNTCWPLDSQHGSQTFLIHVLGHFLQAYLCLLKYDPNFSITLYFSMIQMLVHLSSFKCFVNFSLHNFGEILTSFCHFIHVLTLFSKKLFSVRLEPWISCVLLWCIPNWVNLASVNSGIFNFTFVCVPTDY